MLEPGHTLLLPLASARLLRDEGTGQVPAGPMLQAGVFNFQSQIDWI